MSYDRTIAIEELKLIQDAIFKQEAYSYSAYRYSFVLITGFIIGLFNGRIDLSLTQFFSFSFFVFFAFLILQLIYRESFHSAVGRSHDIQKYLRGEKNICGKDAIKRSPEIYESMHKLWISKKAFVEAIKNARFLVPNLILILLIISAALIKHSQLIDNHQLISISGTYYEKSTSTEYIIMGIKKDQYNSNKIHIDINNNQFVIKE